MSTRGALLLGIMIAGCTTTVERVRDVPELSGTLTRRGAPVSGATIAVVRLDPLASATPGCGAAFASTTTDSSGHFRLGAHREWVTSAALKHASAENGRFVLCVRDPDSASTAREFRVLFRAPVQRWDSLRLSCDLGRDWLAPNPQGLEGRCVAVRSALESQSLAQLPLSSSPALTCDTATTLIEPLRIGPLRVNGSIRELRRLCPGLRDTALHLPGLIGTQRDNGHVLDIGGAPVVIRKSSGIIWRLEVTSPRLRTRDGIGPGTPATRLLDLPGLHLVTLSQHEEPYVVAWHGDGCGLGYVLSRRTYDLERSRSRPIRPERIRAWPKSTHVRRVIVGFCPGG